MEQALSPHVFVNQHFSAPPGKIGLLYGDRKVYSLATLIAGEILSHSHNIVFIDGANQVDPYYLAKLARYQSIDPYHFLDHTYVTRAYTCYQLDISITDSLLDFLRTVDARIVIVYGLIDLFDDDQVPAADIVDIMRRVRQTLVHLKANGISTLLVSSYPHFRIKEREQFFQQMMLMTDVNYRLEQNDTLQHIILEEPHNGKNNTNRYDAHPVRRKQLVAIPPGAAERRSKYI